MKNNTKAVIFVLIDSITYSFVPVFAALTKGSIDIIPYLSISLIISVLSYMLYFFFIDFKYIISLSKKEIKLVIIAGLGFVLSHFLLIYGMQKTNNPYIPSIIFQIYPIIIMILLYITHISKEKMSIQKIFIITLSIVGVIILKYDNSIYNLDDEILYSIIYPVISAFLLSVSVVSTIMLSNCFKKTNIHTPAYLSNFYSKVVSLIAIIPIFIWYLYNNYQTINLESDSIVLLTANGILVYTVGTILYYKGVALTNKSFTIHIVSYLSAVFSVIWLMFFNLGTISSTILLGSTFIITSNILLHFSIEKSKAYIGTIIWTLLVGSFMFKYKSISYKDFYDAITVPMIFYTITLAFLLDRTFKRKDEEETIYTELIYNAIENKKNNIINSLIKLGTLKKTNNLNLEYFKLLKMDLCKENKLLLHKYILSRSQKIKFSETLVLILTAMTALYVLIFYNPEKDTLNIIYKLSLSSAIIFNIFYIYDNEDERTKKILNVDDRKNISNFFILRKDSDTRVERYIAIILLILLLTIFYFIFKPN